ncbi:serine hydrolase [Microseira wollei]|uniref:Beta-lactamase class A catalytic domain-containing protein n=1 Tax=Microseira wollei NIES-4236 TaxID=2530354 RepID=A0AAV3XKV9_9CYAN|nr:serine hydrolase [Microseira wollei]GET41077.1 hypothetical protein MiSe_58890 [Microseira wollei NIES-4236]
MSHKKQSEWDKDGEQIAQLKAELERAYQTIDQLRQENIQLQNQINCDQNEYGYPSTNLKTSHSQKQVYEDRGSLTQNYSNKLSNRQFIAVVTAVAAGLTIMGVGVTSLISKHLKEQNAKISEQKTRNLSSTPILLPAWAIKNSLPLPSRQPGQENLQIVYNLKTTPSFKHPEKLQAIVDDAVNLAAARRLPTKPLSITLIDAKTGEAAGYQQDILRYPASVVKMFWMLPLYAQIESGMWMNEADFHPYIAKMINESDNEAASFIVDQITNTQSLPVLQGEELKNWIYKRQQLNRFFQDAGYKDINISQKTFPIPYLKLSEPQGSDLQLRLNPSQPTQPIRNKITTDQAARLLYETCYLQQAVSPQASQKMCDWLRRNLNYLSWKKEPPNPNEFNPIRAFLGESLADTNVQFYSKAGWTSGSRQEAALIATPDGKNIYILAIFADDPAYAKDEKIFPRMSRLVYNRMTERSFNR